MTAPTNPFNPNDKVLIKIKGEEVKAVVRLVWANEVQVRVTSGGLLWRTIRTVKPASSVQTAPEGTTPGATAEPVVESTEKAADAGEPPRDTGRPSEAPPVEPPIVETAPTEPAESAGSETSGVTGPPVASQPLIGTTEVTPCGVPEVEAARKRAKKGGRR